MPKKSSKQKADANAQPKPGNTPKTTSQLSVDPILGFKLRVLIHDLLSVTKDPSAAVRLNTTTHEHYVSLPYFTTDEAAQVQNATLDSIPYLQHVHGCEDGSFSPEGLVGKTVQDALAMLLSGFLDKRRASGDARPCGPHHLAPLYAALFGIELHEVRDDKFLGRLRRNGV